MVARFDPGDTDERVLDVFRGRRLTELVIFPLCNGDGPASAAVFATARPSGFTPEEQAALERVVPALSTICELRGLRRIEQICSIRMSGRRAASASWPATSDAAIAR